MTVKGQPERSPRWEQREPELRKGVRGRRNANSESTDWGGKGKEYVAVKLQSAGQEWCETGRSDRFSEKIVSGKKEKKMVCVDWKSNPRPSI
jgi:hypothetical protein